MELNIAQQNFCYSESKNIRLLAPAGSGKTISLLWRCNWLFNKNKKDKFLIFTFTRVARDELRIRLKETPEFNELSKNVKIETLNQWGYTYIRDKKSRLKLNSKKIEKYTLINNDLRPLWENKPFLAKLDNFRNRFNRYVEIVDMFDVLKTLGFKHTEKDLINSIDKHLVWLKDNLLYDFFYEKIYTPLDNWEILNYSKNNLSEKILPFFKFWGKSVKTLWAQARITLEDQKYRALLLLEENYNDNKIFPAPQRYTHILIDEFQDINPLDLYLIKKLSILNKSSLTVVGDDDQAIYEWRGSSPNFILKPDNFFDKKFEEYILNINYRSPSNIVLHAQNVIRNNKRRVDKNVQSLNQNDALIITENYSSHIDCLPFIISLAKEAHQNRTTLGVMSRKKGQLIPLQIKLTSEKIKYYAKEDLNILLSSAFSDLKKMLSSIATKNNRKEAGQITTEIIRCCNKADTYPLYSKEAKKLYAYLITNKPRTFVQGINILESYPSKIKGHEISFFTKALWNIVDCSSVSDTIFEIGNNFKGLQKHYARTDDDIFYKEPPFLYLMEYAQNYDNNFWDFIDDIEDTIAQYESNHFNDVAEIDIDIKCPVHLMTVLRAKGKEFDKVVILDVNEGIYPIKFATTPERLEQERRLFYVGITRAKKELYLLTVDKILNTIVDTSRYINEMKLPE